MRNMKNSIKKKVDTINVFFLYVDRDSNLFYIKKNKENLTDNGVLEKINLINLLKKNMIHNSKKIQTNIHITI